MDTTSLIMPDAHVEYGQDLSRMTTFGNMIVAERPDRVILLGDFATVESLSAWDQHNGLTMEGRRYNKDVEVTIDALNLMLEPLLELQAKQRRQKDKIYKPELIYINGNHEFRVERYVDKNPQMEGHMDFMKDTGIDEVFTVIPYGEVITRDGVDFTHILLNGANQAPGGKYAIQRVADMCVRPTIVGHLHRYEVANVKRHNAPLTQVMSCGCFFEGTPDYVKCANNAFWRGVWMVHHVKDGYDAVPYSMDRMKGLYGTV